MRYDAVVIGGGGSGCAEALRRVAEGQKVCLVSSGLTLHSLESSMKGKPYSSLHELTGAGIAVLRGDTVTGVTTMFMDEGLDTGDILLQRKVFINENETSDELKNRLSVIGAELLIETIQKLENKHLKQSLFSNHYDGQCRTVITKRREINKVSSTIISTPSQEVNLYCGKGKKNSSKPLLFQ